MLAPTYASTNGTQTQSTCSKRRQILKPSATAYTYWGMALRDSGRVEEAREIFEKAIETDPTSPNGYNQLGLMYLDREEMG